MEEVKYVLEHMCFISCVAFATEVGISPASVYCILANSLGRFSTKWISHMLNNDQRAMHILAITHLRHWRNNGNTFLIRILTIYDPWIYSFDPQL